MLFMGTILGIVKHNYPGFAQFLLNFIICFNYLNSAASNDDVHILCIITISIVLFLFVITYSCTKLVCYMVKREYNFYFNVAL